MRGKGLFFGALLPGCTPVAQDPYVKDLVQNVNRLETRVKTLEGERVRLSEMITEIVGNQCHHGLRTALQRIAEACADGETCKHDEVIIQYLQLADPDRRGYILSFFVRRPHKAFFFNRIGVIGQVNGNLDKHKEDLQKVLSPLWFPNTRFLVLSHPDPTDTDPEGAAEARGKLIIQMIKDRKFPKYPGLQARQTKNKDTNQVLHWVVPFARDREHIGRGQKPEVLPKDDLFDMAGSKLTRSVWVFRVEC